VIFAGGGEDDGDRIKRDTQSAAVRTGDRPTTNERGAGSQGRRRDFGEVKRMGGRGLRVWGRGKGGKGRCPGCGWCGAGGWG
jgi:hypothetical protein